MRWLKKLKNILIKYKTEVAFILVALLLLLVIFMYRRGPRVEIVEKSNNDIVKTTTVLKDINDNKYYELEAKLLSKEEALARADSLAKALKLQVKNIKGVTMITTVTDTVYRDIKTSIVDDSSYMVEKHDPYVDIVAIAGREKGSISIGMRDTLFFIPSVKDPIIGRTKRTLTIRNANPYNEIKSGYSYTFEEKKPFLTIGPYVGVDIKGKPSVGIALQYPLITFKR